MRCPECGAGGDGNYCARCGAALEAAGSDGCPSCGASVRDEDLYCAECGEPLRERPERPLAARLPWILSGLALVAFAVALGLFIRGQSAPRGADAPPTGGVVSGGGARMQGADAGPADTGAAGETGPAGETTMPSASELADMSPREAGDRLFNRAMRLRARGDTADRAPFFARMGVQAYGRVPPDQVGPDLRFHVGLLQLVQGRPDAARAQADSLLAADPGHLLGLYLALRAAEAAGDGERAGRWRDSLRAAVARADLDGRADYRAHRELLEAFATGS